MNTGPQFKPYLGLPSTYRGGKTSPNAHKLSSNENPWGPSPEVKEALPWMLDQLNLYPPVQDDHLRQALSKAYDEVLAPDCFITGNGGSEILDVVMRGFLNPDDECIYSSPGFIPYWDFSRKFGAKAIDVPLARDSFKLDPEKILSTISTRTKLVFLTSPNNPTGNIIAKDQLRYYLAEVPDHVVTILDEVYCHYVSTIEDYSTAVPYVLEGKHVVGLNSFSKAFGLAGLRVGYAYTTKSLAKYLRSIKRPFALNRVSMAAAELALSDMEYLTTVKNRTNTGKKTLYHAFKKWNIKYWKSEANFILIKVRNSTSAVECLSRDGVIVRPVDSFGAPDCIRISIGKEESLEALLSSIKKSLALFQV